MSSSCLCVWLKSAQMGQPFPTSPPTKMSSSLLLPLCMPTPPALAHLLGPVVSLQEFLEEDGDDFVPIKVGWSCSFRVAF